MILRVEASDRHKPCDNPIERFGMWGSWDSYGSDLDTDLIGVLWLSTVIGT